MPENVRRSPLIVVPPPHLFVASFVIARGIGSLVPIPEPPETIARVMSYVGALLVVAGVLLALAGIGLFARSGTTIVPHGSARSLVTGGPYRFTRNPMYVALTLVYLGAALLLRTAWALPMLAAPLAILRWVVIPFEERRLQEQFGRAYADYCARVRRWL